MKSSLNLPLFAVSAALATLLCTALSSVWSSTPLSAIATTDEISLAQLNTISSRSLPSTPSLPAVVPATSQEKTSLLEPVIFFEIAALSLYFFIRSTPKRR